MLCAVLVPLSQKGSRTRNGIEKCQNDQGYGIVTKPEEIKKARILQFGKEKTEGDMIEVYKT